MSCADSGAGIPGSRPRRDMPGTRAVGAFAAGALDAALGDGVLLTRSDWSSAALHAGSDRAATARPAERRRITVSLRGGVTARGGRRPASDPDRGPTACEAT